MLKHLITLFLPESKKCMCNSANVEAMCVSLGYCAESRNDDVAAFPLNAAQGSGSSSSRNDNINGLCTIELLILWEICGDVLYTAYKDKI